MTKTHRKYDKETFRSWQDLLGDTKKYLKRVQQDQEAEQQIREAKQNNKDEQED